MNPNNIQNRNRTFDLSSNNNKFNLIDYLGNTRLVILFLIMVGIILRLPNLGESLWFDETVYSTKYSLKSLSSLWWLFLKDTPAPLYRVFMFFWTALFGEHELFLRIPSLLFGIFSILLTYRIARTYGSRRTATLAALLLCISPVHIWYSQEATPYSMTLFFFLAAVYAFRRLSADHFNWTWYILYFGFLLIAVFTHYYAAIFLLPLSLVALSAERLTRRRIIAAHCVLILCLLTSLVIKYMAGRIVSGMGFLRPFTLFEWWMLFFNWFSQGNSIWTVNPYKAPHLGLHYLMNQQVLFVFQLCFFGVLLRGLMPKSGRTDWKQTWELSLFLFSMPVVMLFLTQIGYRHLYIERYLFLILPFFLIVIAKGASGFSRKGLEIAIMLFLVIVSVTSYIMFLYKNDTWTVYKQNPDWRGAASYLIREYNASDKLIVIAVTPADTLKYYLRREGLEMFKVIGIKRKEDILLAADSVNTFYLLRNRYWKGNFDKVFQKLKEDHRFLLVSSQSFKGLNLYLFHQY